MKIHWILPFFLLSCSGNIELQKLALKEKTITIGSYSGYCNLDEAYAEHNAVLLAICGDHYNSLRYATADELAKTDYGDKSFLKGLPSDLSQSVLDSLYQSLTAANNLPKQELKLLKGLLLENHNPNEIFAESQVVDARNYIYSILSDYHYFLINEAHHSSQHREFVTSLLSELYHQHEFRYLALEALSLRDSLLMQRTYANLQTGYYTDDPSYANLINEAIKLGYEVISYESKDHIDGTPRDREQAHNIIEQVKGRKPGERVLVYAGYSHIIECCLNDPYVPLGAQLKEELGHDILTVDQVEMIGFLAREKENEYYRYVLDSLDSILESPSIVLSSDNTPILSPLGNGNVDLQVYHPRTEFVNGRPSWLIRNRNFYMLPTELQQYDGYLLSIIHFSQPDDAIPQDQFIIRGKNNHMLLKPGVYKVRILNCDGQVIALYRLEIDD